MSHSSSATVSLSTTQPLSDILPWGSPLSIVHSTSTNNEDATTQYCKTHNRTLLITDSTSADGRFMLHTLALQFLSSRYNIPNNDSIAMEGAVLWITLSPVSERQVVMALRKGMQHNLSGGGGGNAGGAAVGSSNNMGNSSSSSTSGRIHVVSVPLEVADAALQDNDSEEKTPDFSHETYLKQLHQRIVHWLNHRELLSPSQLEQKQQQTQQQNKPSSMGPNLVIIDNGTMLSTIFGDMLTNAFISSVSATLKNHSRKSSSTTTTDAATMGGGNAPSTTVNTTNLLTIRTSSPDDGGLYQLSDEDNVMKGEKLRSEYSRLLRPWLGMGSGPSSGGETNIVQMEEQSSYLSLSSNSTVPSMVYRCGLYELADGIVDISPLESGYARDVLGRLSFVTTWSGKGWWGGPSSSSGVAAGVNAGVGGSGIGSRSQGGANKDDVNGAYSSICVNYRCDDSGVRVMRLRSRMLDMR
eukprot:scaffold7456_cov126-Skeletonema_dohrnii-CCMP3373.AAC.6